MFSCEFREISKNNLLTGTSGLLFLNAATHLGETGKALDTYRRKCENTLLMGDFNVQPDGTNMKAFGNQYKLKYLKKKPTCFKNVDKTSFNDLFLTSNSKCFDNCLTRLVCQISINLLSL